MSRVSQNSWDRKAGEISMSENWSASKLHEAARSAYHSGNLRKGMTIVQRCLDADPDDGRAWELSGLIHYSGGNFRQSVHALELASALVPLCSAGRVCLAHAYAKTDRIGLACDLMTDLIDDDSISVPLLLQVAAGFDSIDQPDLAVRTCQRVIQRDGQVAQAHYDLGFYAGRIGVPRQQIELSIRKAVELSPDVAQYRVGLAGLLLEQEQAEEACDLVADLSDAELTSLDCSCCLQRLATLYRLAADERRVVVCQRRLMDLEVGASKTHHS